MNLLTYNIRLEFQKQEDKTSLVDLLLEHQKVWNYMSEYVFKSKKVDKKLIHDANYHQCRKLFPNCPSQVIIRAKDSVYATYKTLKSNHQEIEDPAKQSNLSIRLDKRIYTFLDNNRIKLTTTGKRIICNYVPYDKFRELFSKYSVCDPLLFVRNNEIWLSVSFEVNAPTLVENSCIGVDLGIKRLATTSEGLTIIDKKFLKEKRRLRHLKRKLKSKSKVTFSRSAKRKLKTVRRKECNKNKNKSHLISNQILRTKSNVIVMEDLSGIKKHHRGKAFNNKQSQVPYFDLRRILTYKAPLQGKVVVTVNPAYTSKDDYRGVKRGKRRGCRYYAADGNVFDADWNAAINIAKRYATRKAVKGIELPVSFGLPLDGKLNLMGRPYQLANCEIRSCKPSDL
ncbi:MAG: transposase [Candidatus Cloacimonetes bacterium]|jgi:IS605 OrfB family transposase|nr:transposase [Candidatus Cloacimonadota bacterium]